MTNMEEMQDNTEQLKAELKLKFPEIPEETMRACIAQHASDKEMCIKVLTRLTEDFLYGCQSPSRSLSVMNRFNNLDFNDKFEEIDNCEKDHRTALPNEQHNLILGDLGTPKIAQLENNLFPRTDFQPMTKVSDDLNMIPGSQIPMSNIYSAPVKSTTSDPLWSVSNGYDLPDLYLQGISSGTDISQLFQAQFKQVHTQLPKIHEQQLQFPYTSHNFTRGFSYPVTGPGIGALHPNISQSAASPNNNKPNITDYSSPLYINISSASSQLPSSLLVTTHSAFLAPTSPSLTNHHSPVLSRMSPSCTSVSSTPLRLSPSPISPCFPTPVSSPLHPSSTTTSPSRPPVPITSHPKLSYLHRGHNVNWNQAPNSYQHQYDFFPKQEFSEVNNLGNLPGEMNIPPSIQSSRTVHFSEVSVAESRKRYSEAAFKQDDQNTEWLSDCSRHKCPSRCNPSILQVCNGSPKPKKFMTQASAALIQHQKKRYDLLCEELSKMEHFCYTLRMDVNSMEQELGERSQINKFPNMEEIQKLREENRRLRVECQCMTMEVDLHNNGGQVRLGVIDESFYDDIYTGPKGPIPPVSTNVTEKRTNLIPNQNEENRDEDGQDNKWSCEKCTYANHPALEHCEMCEMPRILIMD